MTLFQVGRVCLKTAGRDAGRKCVVVETLENFYVLVDGNVRRKKVNIKHLEPLAEIVELKNKASHDEVKVAFEKLGLSVWDTKAKKVATRPKKQKKKRVKEEIKKKSKKEKKVDSKVEKKEMPKEQVIKKEEKKPEVKETKQSDSVEAIVSEDKKPVETKQE